VSLDQLAPKSPSPELVSGIRAWESDYPWLRRAFREIGPGASAGADRWRARIEDELKTTLDFKIKPDGTAAVWCGMSSHDFRHDPTPKELLEGLAEAYRREAERVRGGYATRTGTWKMSAAKPHSPSPALPRPTEDSLTDALGAVFLPRAMQLLLIFVAMTAVTLVLSCVAITVH
jgi:hypothetical protein